MRTPSTGRSSSLGLVAVLWALVVRPQEAPAPCASSSSSIASMLVVGDLLDLLLEPLVLVARRSSASFSSWSSSWRERATVVADLDLALLGLVAHDLDELLAALLGQRWEAEADDLCRRWSA